MKSRHFEDTDTHHIGFREEESVESKDLDENTVVDADVGGNVCAIIFKHASQPTDINTLTVEGIAA